MCSITVFSVFCGPYVPTIVMRPVSQSYRLASQANAGMKKSTSVGSFGAFWFAGGGGGAAAAESSVPPLSRGSLVALRSGRASAAGEWGACSMKIDDN
jgi:hypothetical protein